MDRHPHPAGAGRTRDDARDVDLVVEKSFAVFVVTNGEFRRLFLGEGEARSYVQGRFTGGPWYVEKWEAQLTQPADGLTLPRLPATR